MPHPSIKNERVYRALRRKGMSKERAARISNAMKESATAPLVVAPAGPGGLFSAAGLGSASSRRRKLLARRKAFDESKVKRDDTGKFSGSSGGGGSSAPAAEAKPKPKKKPAAEGEGKTPQEIANQNRAAVAQSTGLGSDLDGAMARLQAGMGGQGDEAKADQLVEQGLAKKDPTTGRYSLSPEGKRYYAAAKKGDLDGARSAMGDAADKKAGADAKRAEREGKQQAREQAKQDRDAKLEKKRADREAAKLKKAEEAKKKKGGGGGGKKEPEKAAALPPLLQNLYGLAGKSFAVTKDAGGCHRWILRTTTAYRDRDGEILSEAALDRDSQRMTATKQYGPLRYWHMGAPDPLNVAAPWGPGVDLGLCDYSQVVGRTRIESGTFYDERVGAAFKEAADQYEASPGFFHTPDQPTAGGVFTDIQTFERSLVPVRLARASNLFTGMHATKERNRMTPEEFRKRAKAFLDDMAAMGVAPDAAQQTLAAAQTAEKAAQSRGIAYKAAASQPVYQLPDGTPAIIVDGQIVALKAMAEKAPMPPTEMTAAGVTEAVDGMAEEAAEGEDEGEGPILGPADAQLVAEAVVTLLMGKMGDMQSQLNAFEEELKARGYARMKEAADTLGPKLDRLSGVLSQYVDDLPAAGHRASQSPATAVTVDDPTAAAAAKLVGAKTAPSAPLTPEEQILAWVSANNGGAMPWDVPAARGLPEGVNLGQHGAPGQQ